MRHDPFLCVKDHGPYTKRFFSQSEEKQFYKNRKKLTQLKDGYYLKHLIEYKTNKYNYRCSHEKIDDSDYMISFGCSHTFGLGIQKPWPAYIEDTYNAGVPGATIYDMIDVAVSLYKAKPFNKLFLFKI